MGCPACGISVGYLKQRETAYSIRRRGCDVDMMKRARIFRWRERPHFLHKTCSLSSTSRADRFISLCKALAFLVNKNKNNVKTPELKKQFIFV
jgi:hypothetical protein